MKKIALLLLALVLVFPVFAADNRVDFSMGYGELSSTTQK